MPDVVDRYLCQRYHFFRGGLNAIVDGNELNTGRNRKRWPK